MGGMDIVDQYLSSYKVAKNSENILSTSLWKRW